MALKICIDFDDAPACEGRITLFRINTKNESDDDVIDPKSIIGKRIIDIEVDEEKDEVNLYIED